MQALYMTNGIIVKANCETDGHKSCATQKAKFLANILESYHPRED